MDRDTKNAENVATKYQMLLDSMRVEFPRFQIIEKNRSWHQRLIDKILYVITIGKQRFYLSDYHTTIGQKVYVPASWNYENDEDRYIIMRHERIHMRQFKKYSFTGMSLLYLFVFFPLGLSYFRMKFERDAYEETLRAMHEIKGEEKIRDPRFREDVIRSFTGPDYGWMWPFKNRISKWYDDLVDRIVTEGS
jgi:hypothetical protein